MKKIFLTYLRFIGLLFFSVNSNARTIIAIDAGHGGRDPGAIGKNMGIKEKDVTLSIAKELKTLLDADPNFKVVMTRGSDRSIQLQNRTEIARKYKANYLVSIHADSSPSSDNLKGASVWVLSNRRANDELGKWLEDHEKQSELLGGAGSVLSNANERYLSQTVLDLQFSHSQRSGYELGKTVLRRLSHITTLAKSTPQHASLSVLRSPDIPSILIETGFLSNATEEQRLATTSYRHQLARAIYNGLVEYRNRYAGYTPKTVFKDTKEKENQTIENKKDEKKKSESNKTENTKQIKKQNKESKILDKNKKDQVKETPKQYNANATHHIVGQDETLYSIARMYKTTPEKLSQLNNIKENKIIVGKKIKVK